MGFSLHISGANNMLDPHSDPAAMPSPAARGF